MGSISGAFTLAAFIVGLFCTRFKMAALAGALPAFLYAALVVIGLWHPRRCRSFFLSGWLTGACLVIVLAAIIASYLRRGSAPSSATPGAPGKFERFACPPARLSAT
jgi:protein-S-isoprenylcysteine O-methyltransferase Ste14